LTGRVAVVTGASRGIGRATARALTRQGARVVGISRNADELERAAHEVGMDWIAASIAEEQGCEHIIGEVHRRVGPIGILVNNAGIVLDEKPIWDQQVDTWLETFQTNLHGAFFLTRLAARDMVEARWGRIVMVSSTAGQAGEGVISAYCASKAALLGLMRSVCHDVAPYNVTCNAVAPGWVRTEMAEHSADEEAAARGVTSDEIWRERAELYPAKRIVSPQEVADSIAFLASDQASAINGEAITIALGGLN
jgi:NAD(P)-dependent dehydrogenase (short-subunit alcohol dehydrogenase family)